MYLCSATKAIGFRLLDVIMLSEISICDVTLFFLHYLMI